MTKEELIAFEREVADFFTQKKIAGPIHLSGGNEEQLIEIFKGVSREDWVFSTYRSHYHALLHGIPRDWLMKEIIAGRSMTIASPDHRFMSSAIVGGCLPIAVGVAWAIKKCSLGERVWCFVGDMAAMSGAFREAINYVRGHDLPCEFVIEDNGVSCDSPTEECWGRDFNDNFYDFVHHYHYKRTYPHSGIGKYVF